MDWPTPSTRRLVPSAVGVWLVSTTGTQLTSNEIRAGAYSELAGCALPGHHAGADHKIKVLVLTGGHGFRAEPFFQMFQDNPEITFTAAAQGTNSATAYDREDLFTYDVVVLYDSPGVITAAIWWKSAG